MPRDQRDRHDHDSGQLPQNGVVRRPDIALLIAAVAGTLHAAASLYWATGGTWLLDTLGARAVETFEPIRWVLWPVGLLKLAAALVPAWLHACDRLSRPWRVLCWAGAVLLIAWGGANTVVANLVLLGAFSPGGDIDRPGLVGHAVLWDPLFLVWGLALAIGLRRVSRARRRSVRPQRRSTGP